MSATSSLPRVRISWSPASSPLRIEELSLNNEVLLADVDWTGGVVEVLLPTPLPLRPILRWRLRAASEAGPAADEMRLEVRDVGGEWHLLGELLGSGGPWWGERSIKSLLRARPPLLPTPALCGVF